MSLWLVDRTVIRCVLLMMGEFIFTTIVKTWQTIAPPMAWSLVVVIGMMLWGPDWFISGLGLDAFIAEYRNYLGVFFLLSLISGLPPVWHIFGRKIREFRNLSSCKKRLQDLTPDEKVILNRFIAENTRTQVLNIADGVVQGLVAEHIIYRSASIGNAAPGSAYFSYNIQPWAWEFLRKNDHLLM